MNKTCLVLSVTILTLSVAFSLVLTASAVWTAPTVDFPDGSPVAPLDQSNVDQTKSAALNLGALNLYSSIDITPIGLGVGQRIGSFLNGTYTGINFELSDLLGSKTTLSNTSGIFDINTNGVILPRLGFCPDFTGGGNYLLQIFG